MKILIVGVGLIGGSFSLALQRNKVLRFAGYDHDEKTANKAKELGIVERTFTDLIKAAGWADLIVLAIPVKGIKSILPEVLSLLRPDQFVIDFGSTKKSICDVVEGHEKRSQFLAAHPIAGTEHSGPESAFSELFFEKNLVLCDTEMTDGKWIKVFEELALEAGFYLTKMSSEEHDRHLAYISHLSHVTSYVLSHTVLNKEKDGEVILDLAGSGFESTVRLAKSSPAMWSSIFIENRDMVLKGIAAYKKELEQLALLIESDDAKEIEKYLEEGRVIRKILK